VHPDSDITVSVQLQPWYPIGYNTVPDITTIAHFISLKYKTSTTMSPLAPVYFGSVNRWECDENDHLNVRFYAQKMQQTLTCGLLDLGLATPLTLDTTLQSIAAQHMRYLAEARIATPLTGLIGLLGTTENSFTVLTELHNTETGLVQASFTQTFNTRLERHPASHVPLPDHAGSRGIAYRDSPFAHLSLAEALEQGFITIGRGMIQADECSADGRLLPHLYMGRVSDSMPNLWARFASPEEPGLRGAGDEGGAVLEYRMTYSGSLNLGERFEVVSGVLALADKTQHFVHQLYSVETGRCVVAAEALAIAMDLKARKAMSISPSRRAAMQAFLLTMPAPAAQS